MSMIAAAVIAGCTASVPRSSESVLVAPGVLLELPSPAAFGRRADLVQLVTARHGTEVFVFEGRLSVTPDRLVLAGTDLLGRRAMTIDWDGARMDVERAPWLPETLPPENVLADIVLLFWPEEAVRRGLDGGELAVSPTSRSIRRGSEEVIAITYDGDPWTGTARLANRPRNYTIEVRSQALLQ